MFSIHMCTDKLEARTHRMLVTKWVLVDGMGGAGAKFFYIIRAHEGGISDTQSHSQVDAGHYAKFTIYQNPLRDC